MTPMVRRRPFKRGKQSTNIAYIGLGANLGEREATIRAAVDELALRPDTELIRVSSLRETDPVGIEDQPRFLNGAAMVETTLGAVELLAALLTIERKLGRDRAASTPGGPRPIDLDLLLYGNATIDEARMQVPHPRLHERRFVLEPLAEIAPELVIPGRGQVLALLAELE
jgi:2-amino-4-hydroxy-6-hydroxymethyldihydropteridine diphosphokinase